MEIAEMCRGEKLQVAFAADISCGMRLPVRIKPQEVPVEWNYANDPARPITRHLRQMPTTDTRENIRSLCAEAGLPLREIRDDGKMLILVPESLANLPDAQTLQELADRIRADEYRHIAFSVDPDAP